MDNYPWRNLKLEEAMKMKLKTTVRIWATPNFRSDNASIRQTFVMKCNDCDQVTFGFIRTVRGNWDIKMNTVDKFSSLEELRNAYPQLFELNGNLYAFT